MLNQLASLLMAADIENAAVTEQYGMGQAFFRVVFGLLLIVILLAFLAKIAKKQQKLRYGRQEVGKTWIKIYDSYVLGPNKSVYIVEMLTRLYLLGVTDNSINILKELPADDEAWLDLKESIAQDEPYISSNMHDFVTIKNQIAKTRELYKRISGRISRGGKGDE